ncbi:copper amine oxidase N-terminal domain-containing protein [Paenibacillus sp. OAS669]|uniref:copper amine oxidase N-terminal domain-containing protein n=1 Tax=Paenibacillus sp. OAS669 TaxID=2663821 RepID=UPI00178ABE50|nr:copper amine oxidase N-terminal domain-containing protein [Paenibacillus sp. OAS669]MBE1446778.1 hypothetical protein [Paenibacillus sp. OAS669]
MKKIILPLSIGVMIGLTATTVSAASESVQAAIAQFVFKVNGEEKELKNSPLVVDGTSYLPVREVAALLGYELDYDEATRTIQLDPKKANHSMYQELTAAPDLTEWIKVPDLLRFYEGNDIKASLSGDSSTTHLKIGVYGVGFPFAFSDQYQQPDVPKLYQRPSGKLSMLVYQSNLFVNKSEIKNLGYPIEEEWIPAAEIANDQVKLDFTPLNGVKKLQPEFLNTEQGILRAMNSKDGVLLNKEDLRARGFIK